MKDTFHKNLKAARQKKGISQREASKLSGVPIRTLQNYEQGCADPSVNTVVLLMDSYRSISYDELFKGVQHDPYKKR